jgi:uncharacterized radical SAM superfamily protein
MKITDFLVMDSDGAEIPADAFGNNVVFSCWHCGHPVLVTTLENQRGSDEKHLSAEVAGKATSWMLGTMRRSFTSTKKGRPSQQL